VVGNGKGLLFLPYSTRRPGLFAWIVSIGNETPLPEATDEVKAVSTLNKPTQQGEQGNLTRCG
jgi:hypothetical protein